MIQQEILKIKEYLVTEMNYQITIILAVLLLCILFILLRHIRIRSQYTKETWKIVKKRGRKAIFWYDQYGNKTYKKPTFDPNTPRTPKRSRY